MQIMAKKTVLLADDEHTLRRNLARVLAEEDFDVIACKDGTEAVSALKKRSVDVIITDLRMPGVTGMDLIDRAADLAPDAGVLVITAFGEVETAVAAMKKGAKDYLCKPLNLDELIFRVKRLIAHDNLARENKVLREQVRKSHADSVVTGESSKFRTVLDGVERVAATRTTVLISGESGTGKEVLARAIHNQSPFADKPFIAVNCGGLPESLVESELFGHARGAFTGAGGDRVGYFEAAHGGTLFLDEIGNLPIKAQPALLRAIEERAVTRVGDNRPRNVEFRLIAATNRNLEDAIADGTFRDDLYYRINVVRIAIPPLRERPEDVPALIEHFVAKYNGELNRSCPGFTSGAVDILSRQSWRGNVRELENVIERALIFADDGLISAGDLTSVILPNGSEPKPVSDLRSMTREFERQHIVSVLEEAKNSRTAAAETLGIGLSSLYRKIEELGIEKAPNGGSDSHQAETENPHMGS